MIEYLYYMLFLLMFLIAILKIRLTLLIKQKLRKLKCKRCGLILSNKIKFIDFKFLKIYSRQYHFSVWGYCELNMRDYEEMKEGFIYIMPLEVNFTHHFAKELKNDMKIFKRHASEEEQKKYVFENKKLKYI